MDQGTLIFKIQDGPQVEIQDEEIKKITGPTPGRFSEKRIRRIHDLINYHHTDFEEYISRMAEELVWPQELIEVIKNESGREPLADVEGLVD